MFHVVVAQSCPTLCNPLGGKPTRLLCPRDSPGKNTGVGGHSLLQGIFPTQGMNLGLLHCRWILYHLNRQRSPLLIHQTTNSFTNPSTSTSTQPTTHLAIYTPTVQASTPICNPAIYSPTHPPIHTLIHSPTCSITGQPFLPAVNVLMNGAQDGKTQCGKCEDVLSEAERFQQGAHHLVQ